MLKLTGWDSNTFTSAGFKTLLKPLKTKLKLNVLHMQLPHVKTLCIYKMGRYSLLSLGIGDRDAQFVSQNMKNLTYLSICKQ
jgi:hypothetical protein